jgi:hypothetical protein
MCGGASRSPGGARHDERAGAPPAPPRCGGGMRPWSPRSPRCGGGARPCAGASRSRFQSRLRSPKSRGSRRPMRPGACGSRRFEPALNSTRPSRRGGDDARAEAPAPAPPPGPRGQLRSKSSANRSAWTGSSSYRNAGTGPSPKSMGASSSSSSSQRCAFGSRCVNSFRPARIAWLCAASACATTRAARFPSATSFAVGNSRESCPARPDTGPQLRRERPCPCPMETEGAGRGAGCCSAGSVGAGAGFAHGDEVVGAGAAGAGAGAAGLEDGTVVSFVERRREDEAGVGAAAATGRAARQQVGTDTRVTRPRGRG